MIIEKLEIRSFGKIRNTVINLNCGINVCINDNSYGKTTIVNFIRAMLYGIEYRKNGQGDVSVKAYMPWNSSEKFGGNMEFSHNGRRYRIERYFGATQRSEQCTLYDMTNGDVVPCENIGEKFLGLTEQSFLQCMYVSQENVTVQSNSNLEEKLAGMVQGGDDNNYDKAVKALENFSRSYKLFRGNGGLIYDLECRLESAENALEQAKLQRKQAEQDRQRLLSLEQQRNEAQRQYDSADKKYRQLQSVLSGRFSSQDVEKERLKAQLQERIASRNPDRLQQDIATVNGLLVRSVAPPAENPLRKLAFIALSIVLVLAGIAVIAFVQTDYRWLGLLFVLAGSVFIVASVIMDKKLNDVAQKARQNKEEIHRLLDKYGISGDDEEQCFQQMYRLQQKWMEEQAEYQLLVSEKGEDLLREKAETEELASTLRQLKNTIAQLDMEKGSLTHAIEIAESSDVSGKTDVVDNLNSELQQARRTWQTAMLATEYLKKAKEQLSDAYLPAINAKCGDLLSAFSEGRLSAVTVNKDFEILVTEQGQTHPLQYFSRGIRELTLFCFKAVLSDIVYGDKIPFLIIDDAFVNLDDKNFRSVVRLLRTLSKNTQIIYMTCHQRGKLLTD